MRDLNKFIIGVIQDYCNKRGLTFESERFALTFGSVCTNQINNNLLSVDSVTLALKKYQSFIKGNNLSPEQFAIEIVQEICANSDYIPPKQEFYTAVKNFKNYVEGNLYPAFQVTNNPQEETGRTLLQAYLRPRGYREAQMSGGNSDLIYPSEKTIVETKIWHDIERYNDGIVELSAYLDSQGYNTGYYVIFDNTQRDNAIVKEKGDAIFDTRYDKHLIHCFFIKIKPIAPSRKRRTKARQNGALVENDIV